MIRNEYTDLLDEVFAKVIEGWEPPSYLNIHTTLYEKTELSPTVPRTPPISLGGFKVTEEVVWN